MSADGSGEGTAVRHKLVQDDGRPRLAPDRTLPREEGWYSAAVVEAALRFHSRTNVSPRRRDRELYKTFGFKK